MSPRIETDGGDWEQQRRAKHLEWYAEEQMKLLGVLPACRSAFKEASKKGNGLVKCEIVFDKPRVRTVMVENIIVDQHETRDNRPPLQLHEWVSTDADELTARFPKKAEIIEKARTTRSSTWRATRQYAPYVLNEVVYLESFRLPVGIKGEKGYRPGRHTIVVEAGDLLDEPWEDDGFPYAVMVFTERAKSWYGISGAERIAGLQRALNKINWTLQRQDEQAAMPTTYVRPADANLTAKSSRIGAIAVVKGDYPHTVVPTAQSPEKLQRRLTLRDAANSEFGQSQMATHATKPAGLDSGVALREYHDQSSQRFAMQEKAFEQLVIDTVVLVLGVCKRLGKKAPTMIRRSRFGKKTIKWTDVDMGEVRVQIAAASNLNRTPAGRMQAVIEYAQAGIISQDEARRLLQHPDLERALSLYTAALENVEHCLDEIADGKIIMPEPYMNLAMAVWRGQMEYLQWRDDGAPEDVIEALRQFVVTAAWMKDRQAQAANVNAPGAVGADASAPPMPGAAGGMPPPLPGGPPAGVTPQAAFSPQAMMLKAGAGGGR